VLNLFNDLRDFIRTLVLEETRLWYNRNPGYSEIFLGLMRLALALLMLLMFILIGGTWFQNVNAYQIARDFRTISPLLKLIPVDMIAFLIYVFSWENFRFALPVFGALASVFVAGAFYVQDIYNLKQMPEALRYVLSSMFAIHYPHIRIDKGQKITIRKETNLIDAIGGPGNALIQPGNAVLFQKLRRISRNIITESVLMTRFETIGPISNLDEQDGYVEEMQVVSRDGIQIIVRDIRYRYRILSEMVNGKPLPRTKENPYPFSRQAFIDLSYYLSVNETGQVSWGSALRIAVTGVIEDYINEHTIDYLTAPRSHQRDPRQEISSQMFGPRLTRTLQGMGTQLLWVDIGHFDILLPDVDQERIKYWATEWEGEASLNRAASEAKRMSLMDQGRAEGQADLLVGITRALQNLDMGNNPAKNVRQLLLIRTAQILDAMRDNGMDEK